MPGVGGRWRQLYTPFDGPLTSHGTWAAQLSSVGLWALLSCAGPTTPMCAGHRIHVATIGGSISVGMAAGGKHRTYGRMFMVRIHGAVLGVLQGTWVWVEASVVIRMTAGARTPMSMPAGCRALSRSC